MKELNRIKKDNLSNQELRDRIKEKDTTHHELEQESSQRIHELGEDNYNLKNERECLKNKMHELQTTNKRII